MTTVPQTSQCSTRVRHFTRCVVEHAPIATPRAQVIDPAGSLVDVSCVPGPQVFCAAVDGSGNVLTSIAHVAADEPPGRASPPSVACALGGWGLGTGER